MIMIDRGDYFQIGMVIRKGSIAALRDRGIEMFRQRLRDACPLAGRSRGTAGVVRGHQVAERGAQPAVAVVSRGTVVHRRRCPRDVTRRWCRDQPGCPGCSGCGSDSCSITAYRTGSHATPPCSAASPLGADGAHQAFQRLAHRVVVETRIAEDEAEPRPTTAPAPLRWCSAIPVLQSIPGYFLGIGLLPEHAPDFARRRASAPV